MPCWEEARTDCRFDMKSSFELKIKEMEKKYR